jgi:hypothetical protein
VRALRREFRSGGLEAPVSIPVKFAEGDFRGIAHETKGMAAIYKLPDGKNVLRFSTFETSNGPIGDQNYELPAGVDLSKYRAVTVWCKRFGVNFATAPLASPKVETHRKDFSLRSK